MRQIVRTQPLLFSSFDRALQDLFNFLAIKGFIQMGLGPLSHEGLGRHLVAGLLGNHCDRYGRIELLDVP